MIPVPSGVRVWLATGVTDMRRGMNTLALQVQQDLARDPHAGDLYVFRGRRGDLIKIPHAHRHREAQRRRPAGLARRCPRPYRRPAADPSARTPALVLEGRPATGLGRITFDLWRPANSRQPPPPGPPPITKIMAKCNTRKERSSPEAYLSSEGAVGSSKRSRSSERGGLQPLPVRK